MRFLETAVQGAFVVDPQRFEDERGFFARTWSVDDLAAAGLDSELNQASISFNSREGTLRGMHFQTAPHEETKLVRCTMGEMYDVVLDLRPDSPSYLQWHGEVLSAENRRGLYIPKGCAHGFLTLQEATEVFYMISSPYVPSAGSGVRWNDPAFGIDWPGEVTVINDRDATYGDYQP